jgi:hypothetical protein
VWKTRNERGRTRDGFIERAACWDKVGVVSNVLEVMCPDHESSTTSTSAEVVVSCCQRAVVN